jgi:hypothetical protein
MHVNVDRVDTLPPLFLPLSILLPLPIGNLEDNTLRALRTLKEMRRGGRLKTHVVRNNC